MRAPASAPVPHGDLPRGFVRLPAMAIGALSVTLAVGMQLTGVLHLLDSRISALFSASSSFAHPPIAALWGGTLVLSFGLAFALLSVPGNWRRWVLWITTLALVIGWAPVLVLAARLPEISAALVAVSWTGFCALIYAARHRMRADESTPAPSPPTDESP